MFWLILGVKPRLIYINDISSEIGDTIYEEIMLMLDEGSFIPIKRDYSHSLPGNIKALVGHSVPTKRIL